MKYQIDSPNPLFQNDWIKEGEFGTVKSINETRLLVTVTEDDYNVPLLQQLLSAIRSGVVFRVTIWE